MRRGREPVRGRDGGGRGGAVRRRPGASGPHYRHRDRAELCHDGRGERPAERLWRGDPGHPGRPQGGARPRLRQLSGAWLVQPRLRQPAILRGRDDDAVSPPPQSGGNHFRAGRHRSVAQGAACHAGAARQRDGDPAQRKSRPAAGRDGGPVRRHQGGAGAWPRRHAGLPHHRAGHQGLARAAAILPRLVLHSSGPQFAPEAEAILRHGQPWRLRA